MKQLQLRMHVKSCITHGKYKKQIARRACGWYPYIEESTFTKTNKSVYFASSFFTTTNLMLASKWYICRSPILVTDE